jgi:hypothetical protein
MLCRNVRLVENGAMAESCKSWIVAALLLGGCSAVPEDAQKRYPAATGERVEMPSPTPAATPSPAPSPTPVPTPTQVPLPHPALRPVPTRPSPPTPTPIARQSDPAPRRASSCAAQIGFSDAAYLARQCSIVTDSPCDVEESCASLREGIRQGCADMGDSAPGFCRRQD